MKKSLEQQLLDTVDELVALAGWAPSSKAEIKHQISVLISPIIPQ